MNTTQNFIFCCVYASLLLTASISFCQSAPEQPQTYEQIMANIARRREEASAQRSANQPGAMGYPADEPLTNLPYQGALQEQALKTLVESGVD